MQGGMVGWIFGNRRLRAWQLVTVALVVVICGAFSNAESQTEAVNNHLGSALHPRLFLEGTVSTMDDETGGTFSPDGREFYFVKVAPYTTFPRLGLICVTRFRDGRWSEPEVVPFSGRYLDFPPKISPDGKTMFFSSSRPAPGKSGHLIRIWSSSRTDKGWGEPVALPPPINDEKSWNLSPSVTSEGTLYFASTRDGEHMHIFRARLVKGVYQEPEKLGAEINSEFNESDPFVSPDEKLLVFAASASDIGTTDRKETLKGGGVLYARGDLYISARDSGDWSIARHLDAGINSTADESTPSLTPDGRYLFFSSERSPFTVPTAHRLRNDEIEKMLHSTLNGHGNIYYISREMLHVGETGSAQ
jgi:Tol biopolymer transport system component